MRELSIILLPLVEQLLVFPSSVFLEFFVGLSMGVYFLWGAIPAPFFSEVFVASVGRSIRCLLYVAPFGAIVGRWLAVWGVSAV